jgi:homoserine O-succinyltransferase
MPDLSVGPQELREKQAVEFRESDANCLDIGLINNMPGAALEATERQFRVLLDAAADGIVVRLSIYALPDVPRTDVSQRHVCSFYSDIRDLWDSHPDGLIVTGTEPRTPNLTDEPYWGSLTRLLEWAEHHTHSAVWSCLAAHAALLHMDGIGRRPLIDKRFGVFECARVSDHPLTVQAPPRLQMPHSRWNDIAEDALVTCGYHILTRSDNAGVDTFVKQRKRLLVFFQGHPEYEADTLLLEYRRDVGRFLRGVRDSYPTMPHGYFDPDTVDVLSALRERALWDRREELLADFPTGLVPGKLRHTWRPAAVSVYRNWLLYLRAQKARQLTARQGRSGFERVRAAAFGSSQETRVHHEQNESLA